MNVQIIVDSRETKLFSLLTERDLDIYKDNISIQKERETTLTRKVYNE